MPRIFAIRHGRTDWNAQGRVQGGGSLDQLGNLQVQALAERLRGEIIHAAYCSPVLRTKQTAYILVEPHNVSVEEHKDLVDLDYGIYSGALLDEVRMNDPVLWEMWDRAPNSVHFPSGESLEGLRRRMSRFLSEMVKKHKDQNVLLATHDSPVRVLSCMAMGLDDSYHHLSKIALASLTILDVNESGVTMILHNDATHLQGIIDPQPQIEEEQSSENLIQPWCFHAFRR